MPAIPVRSHIACKIFHSPADQYRSGKYTVTLSRNPHDLLLQWLSGAGLDEDWEAGLHTSSGRAKEAVKAIIFNRITISGKLPTVDTVMSIC